MTTVTTHLDRDLIDLGSIRDALRSSLGTRTVVGAPDPNEMTPKPGSPSASAGGGCFATRPTPRRSTRPTARSTSAVATADVTRAMTPGPTDLRRTERERTPHRHGCGRGRTGPECAP
jgi:hypothetical protein